MPRGYPNKPRAPPASDAPPRKKRSFFSKPVPILQIVRPPSPPRAVSSNRVLAALQPDSAAVVAAKNFVKDENERNVYKEEVANSSEPSPACAPDLAPSAPIPQPTNNVKKTLIKKVPVKKLPGKAGIARKVPSAKTTAKRMAIGATSIAQRLKEKARTNKVDDTPSKRTLRSHTAPRATESTPAPAPTLAPSPAPAAKAAGTIPKLKLSFNPQNSTQRTFWATSSASASSSSEPKEKDKEVKEPKEINPRKKKEYMDMGFYCNDNDLPEEARLVERVLHHKGYKKPGRPRKSLQCLPPIPVPDGEDVSFPPLPLDHGYVQFFGQEHDFQLPYYMMWERESGVLDGKKRPPSFGKLRRNQFIDRSKRMAEGQAICRCDPSSDCGDNCMNRIMSYLCGKDCPCGDRCTNKSLTRRKQKAYKIAWTGARGFGVFAAEPIAEGDFVMDYRGEIIDYNDFIGRIDAEYKGTRNFYALHYDGDEVIDAGLRGNDARFINHGCNPNLEVRKLQTAGDGYEEYEVGFWATRDINVGEELLYDYNFESFCVSELTSDDMRVRCECGAPNCVGFLGRKGGEKSAKELAKDLEAKAAEASRKAVKQAEPRSKNASTSTVEAKEKGRARTSGPEPARSKRASNASTEAKGKAAITGAAAPQPSPKRKPGRPPKSSVSLMPPPPLPAPLVASTSVTEAPVKRGPGRPRIHPLPDPNAPKRKPGRPRIHPLPDPNTPRRKPGRPRKNPLPTDSVKPEPEPDLSVFDIGPVRAGPALTATERPAPYPKRMPGRSTKSERDKKPVIPGKRGPGRPRKIRNPEDDLPQLGPRITPKQAEKAKRNGAPAGWAFLPIVPPAPAGEGEVAAAPAVLVPGHEAPPPPLSARAERAARLASIRGAASAAV